MLAPSPSKEPPPHRPDGGGGLWGDLWPVLVAFLATLIAGVLVIAIVFELTAREDEPFTSPAGGSAEEYERLAQRAEELA